jgi:ribonuclease D
MQKCAGWIRTTDELASLLPKVGSGPLCIDTEADSMHNYPERVCLVQLSFLEGDFLVDPLQDVDLTLMRPIFEDGGVRKVLHGADYDLRMIDREFGLHIRGLFDTMVAARLVGERAFGLAALLDRFMGVKLDKRFQRADWSLRPLPTEMVEYASMDTRYLEQLAVLLEERLSGMGRLQWAAEEFERLEGVRWREAPAEEAYRRIKGSGSLDRRGLAVLRELVGMRERAARKANRPPFRILKNDLLLAISNRLPERASELTELPNMPAPWKRERGLEKLLRAVRRGLELPEDRLPQRRIARNDRGLRNLEKPLRALCKRRDELAAELGIEPSVLAPRSVLVQALERIENGEDPEGVRDLRRWQAGILKPAFDAAGPDSSLGPSRA